MSRWLIGLILVILAVATTILLRSLEKTEKVTTSGLSLPDYTLEEFKTVRLDPQGHLQEQLTAQKMVHYTDRSTELTTLEIIFYRQGKTYWTVQAERGRISAEGHEMWLQGNTILWWDGRLEQGRVEIISQDIYLRLDQEYAETQAPTTIHNRHTKTQALGAKVFLPNKRIELLSKVRGSYELH
jgi:lipopolysaccharide export system protein LptC